MSIKKTIKNALRSILDSGKKEKPKVKKAVKKDIRKAVKKTAQKVDKAHGFASGGEVKFVHSAYANKFRLKGNGKRSYNIFMPLTDSDMRQAANQLFPAMSYNEHLTGASNAASHLQVANKKYADDVDRLFMKEFGRKPEATDYKVSGIYTDEFSKEAKDTLRSDLREINEWSAVLALHNSKLNKKDKQTEKFAKGGSTGEYLPDTNLLLHGFGVDTNGNHVVKVGFPNDRAFAIQTNGVLHETNRIGKGNIKASALTQDQLKTISKEVTEYVSQFGSTKQKGKLKLYAAEKSSDSAEDIRIDEVLRDYEVAALWSSTDMDTDEPLDANHSISDIAPKTHQFLRGLVKKFLNENKNELEQSGLTDQQIGHSLWLSQNGHGAGFFDYSLDKELEDKLMNAAQELKGVDLEVGDDGQIHAMQAYEQGGDTTQGSLFAKGGKVMVMPEGDYDDPDAVNEIELYAENNSRLYDGQWKPILKNFKRKLDKGTFELPLAAKGMIYYVQAADKAYNKEHGSNRPGYILSVKDRKIWAFKLAQWVQSEYDINKLEGYEKGGKTDTMAEGGQTPNTYKRVISLGKIAYTNQGRKSNELEIEVNIRNTKEARDWDTLEELHNVPNISLSGGVWNARKTDIVSGGQMLGEVYRYVAADKKERYKEMVKIWRQYHLNDTNSGTKRQTEALEAADLKGDNYNYEKAVEHLKLIGLYEDRGYIYGHGWLYKPVPAEVVTRLKELADSFPEFSRYKDGGTIEDVTTLHDAEPDNTYQFKSGGKIGNFEANVYAENLQPFEGSHLEGKLLSNGDYIVLSYGHYPIWYYNSREQKWYGNADRYSNTTARHITQSRPDWNATKLSHKELTDKIMESHSHFENGGEATTD